MIIKWIDLLNYMQSAHLATGPSINIINKTRHQSLHFCCYARLKTSTSQTTHNYLIYFDFIRFSFFSYFNFHITYSNSKFQLIPYSLNSSCFV
jgi:hypothetical protein